MFKKTRSMIFTGLVLAIGTTMAAEASSAKDFPNHPVTLVVAAASGSSPDNIARQLGQELSTKWGQPVVIENIAGLGGILGTERAGQRAPDGYTVLLSTISAMAVGSGLMTLPYDPMKSFEPITLSMSMPNLLVVHPSVPVNTLEELIAYGKQNPTKLRYGHPGTGTTPHLSAELLKEMTGLPMQPIAYKSSAQMATDLLAGHYEVLFHNSSVMLPYVQAGKARALGVTSADRLSTMKDIPTVREAANLKDFNVNAWWGIYVPAGTPASIVAKLNTDITEALKKPSIKNWVETQGGVVGGGSPADLRAHQAQETQKWHALIKKANIKAD
jgi:tripartite-type tricarboxylate transporter receptor subunit TctC